MKQKLVAFVVGFGLAIAVVPARALQCFVEECTYQYLDCIDAGGSHEQCWDAYRQCAEGIEC